MRWRALLFAVAPVVAFAWYGWTQQASPSSVVGIVFVWVMVALVLAHLVYPRRRPTPLGPSPLMAHIVTVDPDGTPIDPAGYQRLDRDEYARQLEAIASGIVASGKTRVLLFVHGGLNNRTGGSRRVRMLKPLIQRAGYYPMFLNWNSDLSHSLAEDLVYIRQGRIARYWGPISAPMALVVALGTGIRGSYWSGHRRCRATPTRAESARSRSPASAIARRLPRCSWRPARQGAADAFRVSLGEDRSSWARATVALACYVVTFLPKLALSPLIDGLGAACLAEHAAPHADAVPPGG